MKLSFFDGLFDNAPKHAELSWAAFCEDLRKAAANQVTHKEHAACFSPAAFIDGRSRAKKNVEHLSLAVLDIDCIGKAALKQLLETLQPFERALYTTLSHPKKQADGSFALRVLLPLTREVQAAAWPSFWRALDELTNHVADPSCKDPSRLYIMPAHYPNDEPPLVEIQPGTLLDPSTLTPPPQTATVAPGSIFPMNLGQRVDLADIRLRIKALKRHTHEPAKMAIAANLRRLLDGLPYGEPGRRNATMLQLTLELDRIFPAASPQAIAQLFAASHGAMRKEDHAEPDSLELVARAVEGARAMRQERMQLAQDQALRDLKARIREARGDGHEHPYTQPELDQIAAMHKIDPFALKQRWIVRCGNRVHFLTLAGYTEGYSQHGIMPLAAHFLSPVPDIQLRSLPTPNATERRLRAFDEVMADYGIDVPDAVLDLRAQYSHLEPDRRRLVIACAPKAQLEPKEHPEVHHWLTLLGGERADKFLQWIACVPDMEKAVCAVYLTGAPGVGKTLFANGLAKIWRAAAPTSFARAIGRFNMELAACPLVFADEGFPALPARQLVIELRNLVGSDTVHIEQKFGGTFALVGPRRLILAANNSSMLDFKSELNENDVEALAVRIMQIEPDKAARDVFSHLNPVEFRAWQTHKIAEHALWLAQTQPVEHQPGNRFVVQGELDAMIRHVIVDSYYPSLACQVIVKYLTDRKRQHQRDGLIRWGDGKLLVNQHGLEAAWDEILPRGPRPPARMASVLRSLSQSSRSVSVRVQNMVRRFWEINLAVLLQWCEENGYISSEICAILANQSDDGGLRVVGG